MTTEESPGGVLHRLHNSGAGPREVFRTSGIGWLPHLDLVCSLRSWRDGPWDVVKPLLASRRGDLPPERIAALATLVLTRLGIGVREEVAGQPTEQARILVGDVVDAVLQRGWHRGMIGFAQVKRADMPRWQIDAPQWNFAPVSTAEVARVLASYAVCAPPLLLWSRPPSLEWIRIDVALDVHAPWRAPEAL